MPPKRTRGQRDETFQVDPDDEEDEEEPLADDDEDEEERKKRQKKADLEGGLELYADVMKDKGMSPKGPLARLKGPNTLGGGRRKAARCPRRIKAYHGLATPSKAARRRAITCGR